MFSYLRLQLKRAAGTMPAVLIFSVVLSVALGVLLNAMVRHYEDTDMKQKLRIGVVGETEDSYLDFGFTTIMDMDISRFSIDFVELTEEEARSQLRNKKLTAYVVIPDEFVNEAAEGRIISLEYVSASDDSGVITVFKDEVLNGLKGVLEKAQRGIYGFQKALYSNGVKRSVVKRSDDLFQEYVDLQMKRSNVCRIKQIGFSEGLSLQSYYICSMFIMFVTIWGVTCCSYFSKRSGSLSRLLASKRCGAVPQIFGEYTSYLVIMLAALAVIITGCALSAKGLIKEVPELAEGGIGGVFAFALKLIPVALAISAMQFLLYEAVSGVVSSALLQFVCALALSYVSGLLYPISFFPKTLQRVSSFLPTGLAREYASSLLLDKSSTGYLLGLAAYFLVFIAAAVILRARKISGRSVEQ